LGIKSEKAVNSDTGAENVIGALLKSCNELGNWIRSPVLVAGISADRVTSEDMSSLCGAAV